MATHVLGPFLLSLISCGIDDFSRGMRRTGDRESLQEDPAELGRVTAGLLADRDRSAASGPPSQFLEQRRAPGVPGHRGRRVVADGPLAHVWGEMVVRAALVARIPPVLRGFLSDARRWF